jgi:DNA-binding CsgD family transcriptional regulator
MDAEQENNIIAKIYEAALLPALWPEVIQDIAQYTQSKSAVFTGLDQLNPASNFTYSYNFPEDGLTAYPDERLRVIDMKLQMPLCDGFNGEKELNQDCQEDADYKGTGQYVFYEKCLQPTGVCYMAGVLLDRGKYRGAVLGIQRAAHVRTFEQTELNFLKRIGVHLRRSLQIHRQISLVQHNNSGLTNVLDCLKTGIILLDQNLCLTYSNPPAQSMIGSGCCLELDMHHRLKTNPGDQERLERLLSSALLEDHSADQEIGGSLAMRDQKGQQIMLTVVPFKKLKKIPCLSEAQHQIALFITDKNQYYSLSRAYLQQSYQLSRREFDLCELLINGYKLEEIAQKCGITLSSVRTYFKNIYEKTACTSQIELMHLLMGCTIHFEPLD